ncbi:uncharacterized protein A4U43_C04F33030 [Asparagus officinalis]|uniref:Fe2OG dioxygenase domain-containing protein n=1 Tax=Asparagus officinalis TaxID=4686 RepID=A0A5P1FAB4_ASPOF|nr:S-norcoclaurine synthase 1-like [Asparagus officinalis]ONK73571.1 uncharacterized protein A4U43_C04F33030 [Asparagus officinalis]
MEVEVGGAAKAPNVQVLAAKVAIDSTVEVPKRYIRPEINDEPMAEFVDLPVIDFNRLMDPELSQEESLKLNHACEEWGFFQLVNHGMPEELIKKVKDDIVEFFKLPLEEKEAYAQIPNHIEGYGPAFTLWEERKLDWGDMLFLITHPQDQKNMRFWPSHPPTFRDTIDKYCTCLQEILCDLLRAMAKTLGLDSERFLDVMKGVVQSMRFNYNPPCPKAADKVIGLSPHSDSDVLTLLLQVNDVHGLQIRKYGKWFIAKPITGAFVVNVGDVLEILTNGRYKSNEHRALVHAETERISLAGFHSASNDAIVGPLPELVKEQGQVNYKTMTHLEYTMAYFSKQYGKSHLESAKTE